jgi:hypothetical protein
MRIATVVMILALLALPGLHLQAAAEVPLPLSAYPRPPQDNGLGIHWTTLIYGQPREVVDYFVAELSAMNVRWVKLLNDGTEGRHHDYLIQQLVSHGIMPVLRIYTRCNGALDLGSLRRLVEHYRPRGVFYYELYNEPELAGVDGGWCNNERPDPDRLLDVWLPAARVVQEAGGFPSVPSLFPPSTADPNWRNSFFVRFFQGIKERGETSILYRSWGAVHNYFLNHPVDYPYDQANLTGQPLTPAEIARYGLSQAEVESINQARSRARLPRSQGGYYVGSTVDEDPDCFLSFIAYHNRFVELFGFEIPLISTEGGVQVGSSEDPRYPKVTEALMAERTIQAYEYMLDKAPAYYFAFTSWLLAEKALGRFGSGWESWAWYHDMQGNHLPVVESLKNHPRRGETRRLAAQRPTGLSEAVHAPAQPDRGSGSQPALGSDERVLLSWEGYPRPPADNGWGIHWAPTLFGQPADLVDRLVAQVADMGIKWVKLMQPDEPKVEHEYLIRSLVKAGIMPVLRVYRPYNTPYEHLEELVREALPMGVFYYELYNEPNIRGQPGGWYPGEEISPERLAELWLPAARAVLRAGGLPGIPALAPGGDYDDIAFLRHFLRAVLAQGGRDVLQRSWLALHNYFLNHPLDYPEDAVNLHSASLSAAEIAQRGLSEAQVRAINAARARSRLPRSQGGYYVGATVLEDSNGFRKFEAYHAVLLDEIGFAVPIISTEGGAIPGTQEDPRYPPVTEEDVAKWTAAAYAYMLDQAPAYYFAFTPWLLANMAGGGSDPAWEGAAWIRANGKGEAPVVEAVRALARQKGALSRDMNIAGKATTVSAWLIIWRDGQPLCRLPAVYAVDRPLSTAWTPPADGRQWGIEVRDSTGKRVHVLGEVGATDTPLPSLCAN